MAGRSGKLRLPETSVVAGMFPHVANFLGARRVAALACSSYLVGMVVPGLHSIYAGLSFDLCEDDCSEYAFFSVTLADPRFRLVSQDFVGGGVSARLETFVRMPPIRQAPMEAVIQCVEPNEFAGTIALIVGGSRGLGELTAKIIVAGGGRVIITYARGKADAENLATEIKRWGGNCEIIAYDVLNDSETPLSALRETPSQIYYYATPPVTPTRSGSFNNKAYDLFYNFYVDGFKQLVNSVLAQTRGKVAVFYPSSVFVDQAPAGMVEYATAKAEGEKLCAELMVQTPTLNVVTHRLPRMLTDLTATVQPVKMEDPLRILLPLVREITNSSRLQ
jgi:NADP-dependent 3-hydroxy acid dehydrogenase YdfG